MGGMASFSQMVLSYMGMNASVVSLVGVIHPHTGSRTSFLAALYKQH